MLKLINHSEIHREGNFANPAIWVQRATQDPAFLALVFQVFFQFHKLLHKLASISIWLYISYNYFIAWEKQIKNPN